jgi:hypothetical protein
MTTKFSRAKGRVQPTPAICKRPPIPQPPGTPLEALSASVLWISILPTGIPFSMAGTPELRRDTQQPLLTYAGELRRAGQRLEIVCWFDEKKTTYNLWLNVFPGGGVQQQYVVHSPNQHPEPFDSGIISEVDPAIANGIIEMRILG